MYILFGPSTFKTAVIYYIIKAINGFSENSTLCLEKTVNAVFNFRIYLPFHFLLLVKCIHHDLSGDSLA